MRRIKDNNNSPHGKFHWFLFPFSSKFPDLNLTLYQFSKFTHVMKPICDTNSEPGLPVVLTHMCQCVFVAISPLTLLYQGHIAPLNFTLTRPLLWPMWKMLMNKEEYLLEGVVQLHAFTGRYTGLCIPSRAVHTIVLFYSNSKIYFSYNCLSDTNHNYEVLWSNYLTGSPDSIWDFVGIWIL